MRGRLPLPPIPGQTVGRRPRRPAKACADVLPRVTTRGDSRCRQHPAEGSRPLPTDRTIDACPRQPPGRACPAPTARRPGNGCSRKPHSVSISPSVGRGAPTPPRPPAAAHSRATRRGRRPRRPAKPPANTHPPGSHPRRGQDPSLRTEPLTPAYANPRAGHARPLPRGGPGTGVRVNPTAFPYPPIRRAGCPHPAATFRHRPSPGQPPAEGSRPLPTDRTIDGCPRNPPGRACPAPTARRPGNGCSRKPHSVSISPSVGRGAPTPPRPSATVRPRANRRGGVPDAPRNLPPTAIPPGNHPQTSAHANLRAGHARPLPRNNPTHLYTT